MKGRQLQTRYEVIVLGAGAAGVAAAVAAARLGRSVLLLERYGFLGGQAVSAYVGTVCGFYARGSASPAQAGEFANEFRLRLLEEDPREVQCFDQGLAFLPYQAHSFESVCDQLLEEAGVDVVLQATVTSVQAQDHSLYQVSCLIGTASLEITAESFVDASGEGVLSRGGAQLISNEYQAPGYVWGLANLSPAAAELSDKDLTRSILQTLIEAEHEGRIAPGASRSTIVPGSFWGNSLALKFAYPFCRTDEPQSVSEIERYGRRAVRRSFACLVESNQYCAQARLSFIATQAGLRSGPRARGEYVLSAEDVRGAARFSTVVAHGLWPMERWSAQRKAEMEYFAEDEYYQIPAEALCAEAFNNLFICGRGLSADEGALSSARVIGTSLSTGYAAGVLAGYAAGREERDVAIRFLQEHQLPSFSSVSNSDRPLPTARILAHENFDPREQE